MYLDYFQLTNVVNLNKKNKPKLFLKSKLIESNLNF